MSGLDNILSRLDKECTSQCEAIRAEAEKKAAKRIEEAKEKASSILQQKMSAAQKEADIIISKADSSASANARKALLAAKVALIDGILEKALNKLHCLDEPSYFTVLGKLAEKNSLDSHGTMYLSARDLERMPASFREGLKNISISDEPSHINDGFILKYGDIEVNCSFSAMLSVSKDELKAVAGEILFG